MRSICTVLRTSAHLAASGRDVVDVEDMMADRDEDMNEVNEISDILSQPQFDNGVDEVKPSSMLLAVAIGVDVAGT